MDADKSAVAASPTRTHASRADSCRTAAPWWSYHRAVRAVVLVGLVACGYSPPAPSSVQDGPPDQPPTDGTVDTAVDPLVDAPQCFGAGFGKLCLSTAPTAPLVLDGTFDTGSGACTEVIDGNCVLAGTTVSIANGADFTARGDRPLVVVASDTLTIQGTLSVASHRGQPSGAGVSAATCAAPTAAENDGGGGGGGAGGSYQGTGGTGGTGDTNDNNLSGGDAKGGTAAAAITPTSVRAGCAGGRGGDGTTGSPGNAGAGGGAVYLIAGTQITIDGVVDAGGAGGSAPNGGSQGGGGGGSGGLIGLDAPTITVTGTVAANGGSGAGGSGTNNNAGPGRDGTASTSQSSGGNAGTGGGGGGSGGAGSGDATADGGGGGSGPGGGGGGGGSAGYVLFEGSLGSGGTFSPAATAMP